MKQELPASPDPAGISDELCENPALLDSVFEGLSAKVPRTKFGCSKSLLLLSEKQPKLLLPKLDKVLDLFRSENRILKWSAIAIVGNVASVDREDRISAALPLLYEFLSCGELITANHAIAALGKIGKVFPGERSEITSRLLEIEKADFDTGECRNIAIGKAILSLQTIWSGVIVPEEVIAFARRQTANTRNATAKKAAAFLQRSAGAR